MGQDSALGIVGSRRLSRVFQEMDATGIKPGVGPQVPPRRAIPAVECISGGESL